MILSLAMMTSVRVGVAAGSAGAARGYPRRTLLHRGDRPVSVLVDRQCRGIVEGLKSSVGRDAEAALPEFAAAPLAHVAAQLVLGPHELGVVILAAHRSAAASVIAALRELRAISQITEAADVEIVARTDVGHLLQELLAHGAGEVLEVARDLDE